MSNYSIRVNDDKGLFRKVFECEEYHTAVGIYCKILIDNQGTQFTITLFSYGTPRMHAMSRYHIFNGEIIYPIPSKQQN